LVGWRRGGLNGRLGRNWRSRLVIRLVLDLALELVDEPLGQSAIRGPCRRFAQEGSEHGQGLLQLAGHPMALGNVEEKVRIRHSPVRSFVVLGRFVKAAEVVRDRPLLVFGPGNRLFRASVSSGARGHYKDQGEQAKQPHGLGFCDKIGARGMKNAKATAKPGREGNPRG
jgi:hypothetical protein